MVVVLSLGKDVSTESTKIWSPFMDVTDRSGLNTRKALNELRLRPSSPVSTAVLTFF
jgi:hypothetical protein